MSPFNPGSLGKTDFARVHITDYSQQRLFYINAGYLPYIYIGAIFRNGFFQRGWKYRKYKEYTKTLDITVGQTTRILPANFRFLNGNYLIPKSSYPLGEKGLETRLLAIDSRDELYKILIPTVEVGRHFHFNSSELIRRLLWGGLKESNIIYNPDKTRLLENGIGELVLRDKIPDSDCWVVSQFAFDQQSFLRAHEIHKSLSNRRVQDQPLCPDIYPPRDGTYTLKMHGKWIRSNDTWRFLVFWIQSSDCPFPTMELHVGRDNDGTNNGTHDIFRKICTRGVIRYRKSPLKNNSVRELITDTEPDKSYGTVPSLLHDSRFLRLADTHYKKLYPLEHTHRSAPNPSIVTLPDEGRAATGDGLYNGSKISPLNIQNQHDAGEENKRLRQKTPPADLNRFEQVLESLAHYDIHYRFISLENHGNSEGKYCHFLRRKQRRGKAWYFNDEGYPRRLILAELVFLDKVFYLFEAEARKKDSHTTLLLHDAGFTQLSYEVLSNVLSLTAKHNGVWDKEPAMESLAYRKFKHTWKEPNNFAQTLLDEMQAHVNGSTNIHTIINEDKINPFEETVEEDDSLDSNHSSSL